MRFVKATYVDDITIAHPVTGEEARLHVWMNPETHNLVAIDNMALDVTRNYIPDPYNPTTGLVFHDTFTGLPK